MVSSKVLFIILFVLSSTGYANGETLGVGPGKTFSNIQSAIDAAQPGDVISVEAGTYYENLVIKTNGISLTGVNKEKVLIDGKKTGSAIRIDQSNNVKVSGFTIQNSGGSGKEDAGVTLYTANNNMVANMVFLNNIVGISIYSGSNNNIVSGNEIRSSTKYGLFIFSSNSNNIYNNNIKDNKFGLFADSARNNNIYSNNFINNNDQVYDNSGLNAWDDGRSGNYWSGFSGSGAFPVKGGSAVDNHPLSKEVAIRYEAVPTPVQPNEQTGPDESTPGFTGVMVGSLVIVLSFLKIRTKRSRQIYNDDIENRTGHAG